jgi:hypothetical protein
MIVLLIILKILLYLLLVILGLVLLLLLVPFNYKGHVETAEGFRAELAVGWAWKLLGINAELEGEAVDVTFRILDKRVYSLKREQAQEEEQPQSEQQEPGKTRKARKGPSIKDLTNKSVLSEIVDYVKRVLEILKPKYMHIYGTYGFEDPSLTGMVCGAAGVIKGIVPNARLHLTPDFTREILELDLRAEGSMQVGSLAYQTIRTMLKKPVRKIIFKREKN